MRELVYRDSDQALQASMPGDERRHRILHAPVAGLDHRIPGVGVGAHKGFAPIKGLGGLGGEGFPSRLVCGVRFVDESVLQCLLAIP